MKDTTSVPRDMQQIHPITAHNPNASSQIVNLSQCAMPSIQNIGGLIYPDVGAVKTLHRCQPADAFFLSPPPPRPPPLLL